MYRIIKGLPSNLSSYKFQLVVTTVNELNTHFGDENKFQREFNPRNDVALEIAKKVADKNKALTLFVAAHISSYGKTINTVLDGWHRKQSWNGSEQILVLVYFLDGLSLAREMMGHHNNSTAPSSSWRTYTNATFSSSIDRVVNGLEMKVSQKKNCYAGILDYNDILRGIVNAVTKVDGSVKSRFKKNADRISTEFLVEYRNHLNYLNNILNKAIAPDNQRFFLRGVCIAAWSTFFKSKCRKEVATFLAKWQMNITSILDGSRLPGNKTYSLWMYVFACALDDADKIGTWGNICRKQGLVTLVDEVK